MSEWNRDGVKFSNDSKTYQKLYDKMGVKNIQHYGTIIYGSPMNESFLAELEIREHTYVVGDRLNKIAFKYYGDSRLWWVLAWFNGKPTDHHCKAGDKIRVPFPLEEVLFQAYEGSAN